MTQENKKQHNSEFVAEMKTLLMAEETRLKEEIGNIDHYIDYGDDEEDNVQEVAESTVNQTLSDTLEKKFRDVQSALKRIDEGVYGICKFTGELIPEDRLRARPTSSSSVDAKNFLKNEA
jgi:RNA polymerase-binding transcription factor DksA